VIETARLVLRRWGDHDRDPYYRLCRDSRVMEFLGPLQSRRVTNAFINRQIATLATTTSCLWVVERQSDSAFLGICGMQPGPRDTPLEGRIEIGWRFNYDFWGKGYAREAACASLEWGWRHLDTDSIWAITIPANTRSWGLMERLGLVRQHDLDFDHPALDRDDPHSHHIVYRGDRPLA